MFFFDQINIEFFKLYGYIVFRENMFENKISREYEMGNLRTVRTIDL